MSQCNTQLVASDFCWSAGIQLRGDEVDMNL